MTIPKKAAKNNPDDFIKGAVATRADRSTKKKTGKAVKFMLELPNIELRTKLKIESIEKDFDNVSAYICAILEQRGQLKL